MVPQASEVAALRQAAELLKFISESAKEIPEANVKGITEAWDAEQTNQWNPTVASKFWSAYSALCTLIKPVSIESISANLKPVERPKWMFWPPLTKPKSLSRRTANRYLWLMMVLLVAAVCFGFVVSAVTNLNSENLKLLDSANKIIDNIAIDVDQLEPIVGDKIFSDPSLPEEGRKLIKKIQFSFNESDHHNEQMMHKTVILTNFLRIFGMTPYTYIPGTLQPDTSVEKFRDAIVNYYRVRRDVISHQQKAAIIASVISSAILPIILGMMGACAYVVRSISDQTRDTTFSPTSPIRHLMRVALGALAGVVIGFGGIFTGVGISSSALSFIAGYAVEPVFATLDSIAEKFKKTG